MNPRITIVFVVDNRKQLYSQFNEDTPMCFVRTYVRDVLRLETFQLVHNGRVITNDVSTLKHVISADDNGNNSKSYVNVVFHVNSKSRGLANISSNTSFALDKCASCEQYRNAVSALRKSNEVLKEENKALKGNITLSDADSNNNNNNINDTHYKYLYLKYRELYFQEKQAKESIIHQLQTNTNDTKYTDGTHVNVLILNCVFPFLSTNDFVNVSVTSKYICTKCLMYVMHYLQRTQAQLTQIKQRNISLYEQSLSQGNRFQLTNSTANLLHKACNDNAMIAEATFHSKATVFEVYKLFYTFRRKLLECTENNKAFANAVVSELQQGIQRNDGNIGVYLSKEIEAFDFSYNTIEHVVSFRDKHGITVFDSDAVSTACGALTGAISGVINEAFAFCGIIEQGNTGVAAYRHHSSVIKDLIRMTADETKYSTMQTRLNSLLHSSSLN